MKNWDTTFMCGVHRYEFDFGINQYNGYQLHWFVD